MDRERGYKDNESGMAGVEGAGVWKIGVGNYFFDGKHRENGP